MFEAFVLKPFITNGEGLVNDKNFWIKMSGYGLGQSHLHASGVVYEWVPNSLDQLSKIEYGGNSLVYFFPVITS